MQSNLINRIFPINILKDVSIPLEMKINLEKLGGSKVLKIKVKII